MVRKISYEFANYIVLTILLSLHKCIRTYLQEVHDLICWIVIGSNTDLIKWNQGIGHEFFLFTSL